MPSYELIDSIPIPSVDDLKYHSVRRYTTSSKEQAECFNISSSPVYAHLDDLDSKFIYVRFSFNSILVPSK